MHRAAPLLLALGVLAAACGGGDTDVLDESIATTVAAPATDAPAVDGDDAAASAATSPPDDPVATTTPAETSVPETTVTETTAPPPDTTTARDESPPDTLLPTPSGVASVTPLGPGRVIGVSTNESVAWVLDTDPAGAIGCEGEPEPALFAVPVDGGERRIAVDLAVTSIRTSLDGRVVMEYLCEGFLVAAYVGRDNGQGDIGDVVQLDLPLDTVPDTIRFFGPNMLTYVVRDQFDPASPGSLYEMDLNTFESVLLTETDLWDAVRVSDGRIVQRGPTALFVDGYDLINLDTAGNGPFAVEMLPSEFDARLAVNTFNSVSVLSGPDLTDVVTFDGATAMHDWSGDRFLLLGPLSTGIGLRLVDTASGEITILETPPPFAGAYFARQGAAIVMSTPGVDLFSPEVLLVELG